MPRPGSHRTRHIQDWFHGGCMGVDTSLYADTEQDYQCPS